MHELAPSVHSAIIEPALSLAHKLHVSIDKYSLSWTSFAGTRLEERSSDPRDYIAFECVDILRLGKLMKTQAVAAAGRMAYMLDLTPALVLEIVKADAFADPRVLNKSRILVAAMKEGEDPFAPPRTGAGEATVVAWLLEKVRKHDLNHR